MDLLGKLKRSGNGLDFTGKVVAVYCGSGEPGGVFKDARIVKIGFHSFLVGRSVSLDPSHSGFPSVVTWISVAEITRLMVFESAEDVRRAWPSAGSTGQQQPPLDPT